MIVVEKLQDDRWKEFRDLRLESLKEEPTAFGSSYDEEKNFSEEEWRRRMNNAFSALSEDKLIGTIMCIQNSRVKTRHVASIYGFYVKREFRGQGVGRKLINFALEHVHKSGQVIKIKLEVNPDQEAAVKLYQSCGFKVVGLLRMELWVEGRFYDELIMERFF